MTNPWFWAVVALALLPLAISIRRGAELFCLRVRGGDVRFVRGKIPASLLADIRDILRAPAVARAELRAVVRSGAAEWVLRGEVSDAQMQQLRNVLGNCPIAKIRAGGRPSRATPTGLR